MRLKKTSLMRSFITCSLHQMLMWSRQRLWGGRRTRKSKKNWEVYTKFYRKTWREV